MSEKSGLPPSSAAAHDGDSARFLARRRFARAGLSAPVVLGTLVSKPVLGQVATNCTISGQISGNVSSPGDLSCVNLGYTPERWRGAANWDGTGFKKDVGTPKESCDFAPPKDEGSPFTGTLAPTFLNAFERKVIGTQPNQSCVVVAHPISSAGYAPTSRSATMYQVLQTSGTYDVNELGRQAVASLLNAAVKGSAYPLTKDQVIALFNEVWRTGEYVHSRSPLIKLTLKGVINYLRLINGSP